MAEHFRGGRKGRRGSMWAPGPGWRLLVLIVGISLLLSACGGSASSAAGTPTPAGTRTTAWAVTPVVAGATAPPSATATPRVTPTVAPTRTPAATGKPAATAPAQAIAAAEGVLAKVSTTRSLTAKAKVPTSFLPKDQVRPYFKKALAKDKAEQDILRDQGFYVALGLLSEKDNLRELWLGLLDEQVVGMYELESKEMKLVGTGGPLSLMEELTLAHEYAHALQDQNFAAGDKAKQLAEEDDDRAMAFQALVEGDATLVQVAYGLAFKSKEEMAQLQSQAGGPSMAKLQSAPSVLHASLMFPYLQGATFVGELFREGGWAAVNKAYANPPQSTEQILHPQKYRNGEPPVKVTLPNLPASLGPNWQSLGSETFGEMGWLIFLSESGNRQQAPVAAAGWGGDRYVVLQNGGKYALAALTEWDTADDSQQFLMGVRDVYRARGAKLTTVNPNRLTWTSSAGSGLVLRDGLRVLLVTAPDEATVAKPAGAFPGY